MGNCVGKYNLCKKSVNGDFEMTKIPLAPLQSGLENTSTISTNSFPNHASPPKPISNPVTEAVTVKSPSNSFSKLSSRDNGTLSLSKSSPANIKSLSNSLNRSTQPSAAASHEFNERDLTVNSLNRQTNSHSHQQQQHHQHHTASSVMPPIISNGGALVMLAIFDYHSRTDEELSLRKGDKVYVLNNM